MQAISSLSAKSKASAESARPRAKLRASSEFKNPTQTCNCRTASPASGNSLGQLNSNRFGQAIGGQNRCATKCTVPGEARTATNNSASVTASGITLQPAVARSVAWNSASQTSQWSRAPPSPTNTRTHGQKEQFLLSTEGPPSGLCQASQRSQLPASLPRSWQIPRKWCLRKMDLVCKRLQLNWTRAELSADWTCGRCNQQAPRTDGSGDSDGCARNSLWCPLPNNV